MNQLYETIMELLKKYNIAYQEFGHEPIVSYEDAEREKKKFNWQGVESKNVFIKDKNGEFYVYITVAGEKVDFKKLKDELGIKCSIASAEEVKTVINCVPGCVVPFGFQKEITIILEKKIFSFTDYLFSPGVTTRTIQTNIQDLKVIFENLPNKIIWI